MPDDQPFSCAKSSHKPDDQPDDAGRSASVAIDRSSSARGGLRTPTGGRSRAMDGRRKEYGGQPMTETVTEPTRTSPTDRLLAELGIDLSSQPKPTTTNEPAGW